LTDLEAVLGCQTPLYLCAVGHEGKGLEERREMNMRTRNPNNPAEPSAPPIREPIEVPENPDMPVREPDPEDPNEI
jgi:hypothetical protein